MKGNKEKKMACGGMTKKAMGGKIDANSSWGKPDKEQKMIDTVKKFRKGGMARGR